MSRNLGPFLDVPALDVMTSANTCYGCLMNMKLFTAADILVLLLKARWNGRLLGRTEATGFGDICIEGSI